MPPRSRRQASKVWLWCSGALSDVGCARCGLGSEYWGGRGRGQGRAPAAHRLHLSFTFRGEVVVGRCLP